MQKVVPADLTSVQMMLLHSRNSFAARSAVSLSLIVVFSTCVKGLFFPRGGSFGYLAAVAMPLDLLNRDVYVAFNFEANYGLPSNDVYHEWIDRWNLDKHYLGIGNNVTTINRRRAGRSPLQTRSLFYRSLAGYLEHFNFNGSACVLKTICEVSQSNFDVHNGLLGSLFKVLFLPSTSVAERYAVPKEMHDAEWSGHRGSCWQYTDQCSVGPLDFISRWL